MSWVNGMVDRIFGSIIRLQSISGSTLYMNAKSEIERRAQINTLYCVQHLFM